MDARAKCRFCGMMVPSVLLVRAIKKDRERPKSLMCCPQCGHKARAMGFNMAKMVKRQLATT